MCRLIYFKFDSTQGIAASQSYDMVDNEGNYVFQRKTGYELLTGYTYSISDTAYNFTISSIPISASWSSCNPNPIQSATSSWQILLRYDGKKLSSTEWISSTYNNLRNVMGSPGVAAFMTMSMTSSGANTRTSFGQTAGLYSSFFTQTNITKIAYVDGTGNMDPTTHTNYLIYDLVSSTGAETICDILKRLDLYQKNSPLFQNNDSVWGTPSVIYHTAGLSGYSGLLVATGGIGFRDNSTPVAYPSKFCIMGINRDSDNDIQALCAYSGTLLSGKGDAWRMQNPTNTFWSYWGNDFHSSSVLQRIGASLQSAPGVSTGASWTGSVYLMAY